MSEKPRAGAPRPGVASGTRIVRTLCAARPRCPTSPAAGGLSPCAPSSDAPTLTACAPSCSTWSTPRSPPRWRAARTGAPGSVVGPHRGADGRDLRQRPPSLRPQHRALPHPRLHRDLSLRAGARDRRPRRRGGSPTARWQQVPVSSSTRASPALPRGIDPPCANCARGWTSSCLNLDSRIISSGRSLGYTEGPRRRVGRDGAGPHVRCSTRCPTRFPIAPAASTSPSPSPATGSCGPGPRTATPCSIVGRRHHRARRPRGAARAVPALPGDRAGAPRAPRSRRYRRAVRTTSCSAIPTTGTGRRWRSSRRAARRGAQAAPDADGRLSLRRRGGRVARLGHRGAARRRPPRHRAAARRGRHQRGRPDPDLVQGGRARRLHRPHRRRRFDPGSRRRRRAGTRSTVRSTCSSAGLLPDSVVVTHEFAARGATATPIEAAIDRQSSHAIKVVFRP